MTMTWQTSNLLLPSPPKRGRGERVIAAVLGLLAAALPARAADYVQKLGPAELRLAAPVGKDGRVAFPLAGALLSVRVTGGPPVQAASKEPPASSKSWHVRLVAGPAPARDAASWEQKFYLEPLGKPGDLLDLAWPALVYRAGNRPEQTAAWKPIPVKITTEIKEASLSEMRPGTGPEAVPPAWSWRQSLAWVLPALVLAVLLLVLAEVVRRRVRRTRLLTPDAWALRELRQIAGLDLEAGGAVERFPVLVSDVVRRYLELRFHLHAPRQTTAEFLAAMQQAPQLGPGQQELLREFLQRCDLAKFARATLSVEECRELAEAARTFVEQTTPPD